MQLCTESERTNKSQLMLHECPCDVRAHQKITTYAVLSVPVPASSTMRFCAPRCREVLEAAMRGAGVAGSLSVMLRYDAATPLVETQAQASTAST